MWNGCEYYLFVPDRCLVCQFRYRLDDPVNREAVMASLPGMLMNLGSVVSASNFQLLFTVGSARRDLAEPSTLTASVRCCLCCHCQSHGCPLTSCICCLV